MTSQTHANGWHMLRAGLFLAAAAAFIFLGSSLLKSLAPEAQTARMWVQAVWFLASGALLWVGLCHLLQPLIRLIGVHVISVVLLVFWSAVLLYFYYSGRVQQYLPDDGLFRPLMLTGGIGMGVLGIFNLLVGKSQGGDCCGHDHGHDHHHHAHDHGHGHDHGCCGHDNGEPHSHSHAHEHGAHKHGEGCCGGGHEHHHHHEHGHEPTGAHRHTHTHHHHDHGCCGHDHEHDHGHSHGPTNTCSGEDLLTHAHDHSHAAHDHSHGILTSPRWFNQSSAVLVLLAPLALAAAYSPDQYSQTAVMNKNLYNQTYGVGARAEQFSLKKPANQNQLPKAPANTAATAPAAADMPPPANDAGKVPGAPNAAANAAAAQVASKPTGAAETQSYGSFTLADLEQQVPRNKDGNFELNVPEIYYTAGDAEVQKAIAGQPIETVAQVLPEKVNNENGHRLRVFRMLVQCCAADARPYSVPVDFGKKAPEFKDMAWVRVKGTLTFPKEGDQIVPVIEAKSIEETTAPDDAMLY